MRQYKNINMKLVGAVNYTLATNTNIGDNTKIATLIMEEIITQVDDVVLALRIAGEVQLAIKD